jgi:hypothetical protein
VSSIVSVRGKEAGGFFLIALAVSPARIGAWIASLAIPSVTNVALDRDLAEEIPLSPC